MSVFIQSVFCQTHDPMRRSLSSLSRKPQHTEQEVPPLDVPELLGCLVKHSKPLLDRLGLEADICHKILDDLCRRPFFRSISVQDASLSACRNPSEELDLRIANVNQSTGYHCEGGFWDFKRHKTENHKHHVSIVTTASLPWMTGTAVNPLFRAAYLAKSTELSVLLLVPWLCKSDQKLVYPNKLTFRTPEEQEVFIRNWLEESIGFKTDFRISFYPGKFSRKRRSIIPSGDTTEFVSSKEADIAILEEPEHLNWYHHGKRWPDKFNHVVGIVHTNYLEYIKRERNGALQAFFVKHVNNLLVRAHCNKVLRLSAATQDMPKSVVCNVHGVNPKFFAVGEKIAADREHGKRTFDKGAYFLGKMVWAKGYKELIDMLAKHKSDLDGFNLDIYGNGEDAHAVQLAARKLNFNLNFLKGRDHVDDSLHGYKVFVNPSVSDVLCTTTTEALAMGKFVICADHPSNDFFKDFSNCLMYTTSDGFVARVKEAMTNEPVPLTPDQKYNLSWEAATRRFMESSELHNLLYDTDKRMEENMQKTWAFQKTRSVVTSNLSKLADGGIAFAHYCFTGTEFLRLSTGAIPGTRYYNRQHAKDLHLLPPFVQNPLYGW